MQAYLQNLLKEGKDQLETWVRYHPARATAYLAAAGSVIFLLDNFNSEVMKQWKQQLAVDSAGDDGFDYAFTSFDFDFVSSDSFSDFDSSFDSSFDGGSGSSDWGGDGGGDGGGGDGGGGGE
jgi:uncharacterized membrane protein YgcG